MKEKIMKVKKNISKKITSKKKSHHKLKIKKGVWTCLFAFLISMGILTAVGIIAFSLYIVFTSPEFSAEKLYNRESSIIYWNDGSVITRLGTENRVIKNYEDYPQVLVDALVATEDSRFFQHTGVDAARFIKATFGQLLGQSGAGGASTLSMQLAKNKFNGDEARGIEGIVRKFKDIYVAVFKIEKNYTKEEIIEMYLNSWWFAQDGDANYGGICGVEQASQYFFGKSVSDLSLPEAAMLVGMVNNPVYYNPYIYPENANERKNTVLSLMNRHGYITEEEMKDAQKINIKSLIKEQKIATSPYQVLIDYVIDEIKANEGINVLKGTFEIYTTFDKKSQDVLNNMLNGAAEEWRDDVVQVATAVTSVDDGSIVALAPGRNYVAKGSNRASSTGFRNQPGSTAKPLVDYGPLIEYRNASSGQMFIDFKYTYNNGSIINNWDNSYKGIMSMKDALSSSRNVTALEAFHQNNKDNIKDFLSKLSITEENYGDDGMIESLSIGGFKYGLTPLESSAAYAAFARGGYFIEPYSYRKIVNKETEEVKEYKYEKVKAMSPETAYMITDILIQATHENVGGPINYNLRNTIASKSGTTNYSEAQAKAKGISVYATPDHWVNTYNNEYSISMWYGYDKIDTDSNHYLTSNSGSGTRGKISAYLANNLLTKNEAFSKPDGIKEVTVEKYTLPIKLASEYTPQDMKETMMFKEGTEPSDTSTRFQKLSKPGNGNGKVSDKTVTLSWDKVNNPQALDTNKIKEEFEKYFSDYQKNYSHSFSLFENQYLDLCQGIITNTLGSMGYQVYLKQSNGSLKDLGWTQNNSFTYKVSNGGNYTFVIKSAYSIYGGNQSDGLEITVKVQTDNTDNNTNSSKITMTSKQACITTGSTIDPKKYVTVKYDGKDITNDSNLKIYTSEIDTTKKGLYNITYKAIYEGESKTVSDTVNVTDQCPNN